MPPVRKKQPTYPLGDVQRLVANARVGRTVLSRAGNYYGMEELSAVKKFVLRSIKKLTNADFVYSEEQEYDDGCVFADIYVLCESQRVWFVKFYLQHGFVTIVSFHRPDRDILRADGKKISAP